MKKSLIVLWLVGGMALAGQAQDIFDVLRKGDVQAVKAAVEKTPGLVDARDGDGRTPLHYAGAGGNAELVGYFVSKGAKLELEDAQHKTPLHLAATNDRADAAACLLKRGAALETRDDNLRTALVLCARERGQAATGRVLIEAGADINAVDKVRRHRAQSRRLARKGRVHRPSSRKRG